MSEQELGKQKKSKKYLSTEDLHRIFTLYPSVTTDSRKTESGDIFFALSGDNFDGNSYALSALEKGASYAVIDNEKVLKANSKTEFGSRLLLVKDTLKALQDLGEFHRKELGLTILAISGSNGKTTTKELLGAVLSRKYKVQMTSGNLNNHIGVPLTLLNLKNDCELAIVEMGASHCQEIALLCKLAAPNFGLLTNVGKAHLEGFGGEQGVVKGKGELFDYLEQNSGVAFYRTEDTTISSMVEQRKNLSTVAYSSQIELPKSNLVGDYNRFNIAAAVCVGEYFAVDKDDIKDAISSYMPTNNRSQRSQTAKNTLIVDCYNANPSSMKAALENLQKEELSATLHSKIAILGDMLELGEHTQSEHTRVLELLEKSSVTKAFLVGELFSKVAENFTPQNYSLEAYPSRTELIERLEEQGLESNIILLKGSRALGLEKLIEHL